MVKSIEDLKQSKYQRVFVLWLSILMLWSLLSGDIHRPKVLAGFPNPYAVRRATANLIHSTGLFPTALDEYGTEYWGRVVVKNRTA